MIRTVSVVAALLLALGYGFGGAVAADREADGVTIVTNLSAAQPGIGKAAAEEQALTYFDEFVHKFQQGGLTMYFLLFLSVVGIACIIERLSNLNRRLIRTPGLAEAADRLFRARDYEALKKLCQEDRSILGRIILVTVEHRGCSRSELQSLCDDIGSRALRMQMQKAYPLAIVATLSPLLGLFGTVIGMIGAFDTVAQAGDMGNAAILADDIAKALITTAGGLMVGIPMLGFYHYFKSRTSRFGIDLEEDAGELFSAWFLKPSVNREEAEIAAAGNNCCQGEGEDAL